MSSTHASGAPALAAARRADLRSSSSSACSMSGVLSLMYSAVGRLPTSQPVANRSPSMRAHALPHLESANANFVTPRLLVGGDLSSDRDRAADQLRELVAAGVTHIIDVRIEATDERFVAEAAPSLSYCHHGVDDRGQRVPGGWFEMGTRFILRALADPQAIVLAHCHMGINRGPSLGFAALLALGWD